MVVSVGNPDFVTVAVLSRCVHLSEFEALAAKMFAVTIPQELIKVDKFLCCLNIVVVAELEVLGIRKSQTEDLVTREFLQPLTAAT